MTTRVKDLKRGASVEEGRLNELRERTLTEAVPGRPPTPMVEVSPGPGFVETPFIKGITERALTYAEGGFPVHFRGPTGCGKTTLAIHLATQIGHPMMLLVGDEELATSDLVGGGAWLLPQAGPRSVHPFGPEDRGPPRLPLGR